MVKLKYYSVIIISIAVLLLILHSLLFISLGLASYFMDSDEDINKAGKCFLLVSPFLFGFGFWTFRRTIRTILGHGCYHQYIPWGLSFYSGLFGIGLCDLALALSISWFEHFITTLSFFIGAFFLFSIPTYFASQRFFHRYQ